MQRSVATIIFCDTKKDFPTHENVFMHIKLKMFLKEAINMDMINILTYSCSVC